MSAVILDTDAQSLRERFDTPEAREQFAATLADIGNLYDTAHDVDHQFALAYLTLRGDDPWQIFMLGSQLHAALRYSRERDGQRLEVAKARLARIAELDARVAELEAAR